MDKPTVDDAPGLIWRRNRDSWTAAWQARTDAVQRGFRPAFQRVWSGAEAELDDVAKQFIRDQCRRLQDEMLIFGRGGIPIDSAFDGTLGSLIKCFQTDPDSSHHKARYATRRSHGVNLRILALHGDELLSDLRARTILRWHEEYTARGVAMAHSLMSMLRTVIGFGATILEDEECARLRGILSGMKFKMPGRRTERMTADQATAIRAAAHAAGLPSIALAQALQFDLMLRQKDVIGEWVPLSEPGTSEVTTGTKKWLRGMRWSEIDGNLILRHTTSKRLKDIQINLRLAPMVMEELSRWMLWTGPAHGRTRDDDPGNLALSIPQGSGGRRDQLPTSGPVIVYERAGRPYTEDEFRYNWRLAARAAGVPDRVWNMDSRAGAISEADLAGADIEHIRDAATHSDASTTRGYSRERQAKIEGVMRKRAEYRTRGSS